MKTYSNLDVIEVVDGGGSYPSLLWIVWATLEEISTQNGPFNFYSNSMSSCVSQ